MMDLLASVSRLSAVDDGILSRRSVRAFLPQPVAVEVMLVCGMSMGWADPNAVENTLLTEREAVDAFTTFVVRER